MYNLTEVDSIILSQNIKKLRMKYKWTQQDLADRLNMSKGNVSRYENAKMSKPHPKIVQQFADVFDVSYEEMVELEKPQTTVSVSTANGKETLNVPPELIQESNLCFERVVNNNVDNKIRKGDIVFVRSIGTDDIATLSDNSYVVVDNGSIYQLHWNKEHTNYTLTSDTSEIFRFDKTFMTPRAVVVKALISLQ